MSEDFIIEEDIGSEGSSSRRPFLIAVGILLTILILAMICSATLLLRRNGPSNGDQEEIAAIETQNAIVAVTNEAVTQTISAMATEDARPTETPEPPATNTPRPTSTPQPTFTPVVQQAEDDEMTATADIQSTLAASNGSADETPTPISALSGGSGGDESLPQTGIETWGALVAAFAFIALLFAARRLRSS